AHHPDRGRLLPRRGGLPVDAFLSRPSRRNIRPRRALEQQSRPFPANGAGMAEVAAQIPDERKAAAADVSLVYTTDLEAGIRRRRAGKGFTYLGPDGERVRDRAVLERIRSLVIPPAWTDVWI